MKWPRILLASPVLAFPLLDELSFGPGEGDSTIKSIESVFEIELGEITMEGTMNGETVERVIPAKGRVHRTAKATIEDELLEVSPERPTRIRRTIQAATRESDIAMGANERNSGEVASLLVDRTVVFAWNEEEESYDRSPAEEDEDLDERLLDALRPDADFRFLLPEGEVDPGDVWTLGDEHLLDFVFPGGNLHPYFLPDEKTRAPADAARVNLSAPFAATVLRANDFVRALGGEIEATYEGSEDGDGARLALITLVVTAEASLDAADRLDYQVARGIPEGVEYEYAHGVDLELEGEGRLRWDLERGVLHDFTFEAVLTGDEDVHLASVFDHPETGEETDVDIRTSTEWSGTFRLSSRTQ